MFSDVSESKRVVVAKPLPCGCVVAKSLSTFDVDNGAINNVSKLLLVPWFILIITSLINDYR